MGEIHFGLRDQPYSSSEALHSSACSDHRAKVFSSQLYKKNMQVNIKTVTVSKRPIQENVLL